MTNSVKTLFSLHGNKMLQSNAPWHIPSRIVSLFFSIEHQWERQYCEMYISKTAVPRRYLFPRDWILLKNTEQAKCISSEKFSKNVLTPLLTPLSLMLHFFTPFSCKNPWICSNFTETTQCPPFLLQF